MRRVCCRQLVRAGCSDTKIDAAFNTDQVSTAAPAPAAVIQDDKMIREISDTQASLSGTLDELTESQKAQMAQIGTLESAQVSMSCVAS